MHWTTTIEPYSTDSKVLAPTRLLMVFGFAMLIYADNAQSDSKSCLSMANTELEQVYCKVKASGHGKTLPSLQDFRKNPANMQRLLLKNPARKARIELPNSHSSQSKPRVAESSPKPTKATTPASAKTHTNAGNTGGILRCILQKNQIQCDSDYYLLRTNLPNHELEPGVLDGSNRLEFPDEQTPLYRKSTTLRFLSDCYPVYIEKMLTIGLGDSTMSFTRFAAMYEEIQKTGADFSQRFSEMFELLKAEKASNAVRRRYSNDFPEHIEQCMFLSGRTIVCDNVKTNWVYQR